MRFWGRLFAWGGSWAEDSFRIESLLWLEGLLGRFSRDGLGLNRKPTAHQWPKQNSGVSLAALYCPLLISSS